MVQAIEETENPDLPQAVRLLKEMNTNVQQVSQLVDNMLVRVRSGELSTDKGLSFLEMKYQMLLSYLINLTYIVLRKCSGERIESDPSIDRLVEIRTVLEKIRPIDSKLKYQIDKLVKTAVVGSVTEDDPQSYHANPDNLVSKIDDNDNTSDESDNEESRKDKSSKSNIYVPPKLAAVHFDESTSKVESEKKNKERSKKQFLNSSVMRELRDEYSEAPMEVTTGNHVKHSISKYEQEKTEYEENYLTRLPVTKAEKNRRKKLTTVGVLADEITGSRQTSRKHKLKSKKGKGFKRRRIH
ncbi:Neuroguidin-A [Papilio machaon]|uniref:Neuroguidin-A n=1 Tax=Papilio machaon TaxID=76193 RepID=A0A194QSG2_PAPMA|nr:Neuroguidin-A [Papilio machaon]